MARVNGRVLVPYHFEDMCKVIEAHYGIFVPMVRDVRARHVYDPENKNDFYPGAVYSREHIAKMSDVNKESVRLENFGRRGSNPVIVVQNALGRGVFSEHSYIINGEYAEPLIPVSWGERRSSSRQGRFVLGRLYEELNERERPIDIRIESSA